MSKESRNRSAASFECRRRPQEDLAVGGSTLAFPQLRTRVKEDLVQHGRWYVRRKLTTTEKEFLKECDEVLARVVADRSQSAHARRDLSADGSAYRGG